MRASGMKQSALTERRKQSRSAIFQAGMSIKKNMTNWSFLPARLPLFHPSKASICPAYSLYAQFRIWTTSAIIINEKQPRTAVVVGGGFIGLEIAENLQHRGIEVTVIEMLDQVWRQSIMKWRPWFTSIWISNMSDLPWRWHSRAFSKKNSSKCDPAKREES